MHCTAYFQVNIFVVQLPEFNGYGTSSKNGSTKPSAQMGRTMQLLLLLLDWFYYEFCI